MISSAALVHSTSGTSGKGITWEMNHLPTGDGILNLSGDLKPGWLGRLSSHLSHQRINIVRGSARKSSPLCWESTFEIDGRHCNSDQLKTFNPVPAVTGSDAKVDIPQLKISDFQVEHSTRLGGSLYAEVSGRDCLGFLYGMLRTFSFYSLFPAELEIATTGMMAQDRFWLKGIGSSVPTREDSNTLHERLAAMLSRG